MPTKPSMKDKRRARALPVLTEPEVAPDAPKVTPDAPKVTPDAPKVTPDAPEVAPDAPEVAPDAPEVAPDAPKVTTAKPKVTTAKRDVTRKSVYMPDGEWDAAKSAYLADWRAGGEADSIEKWISGAVRSFAVWSTSQRAEVIPVPMPRAAQGEKNGRPRSYGLDTAAVEALGDAMTADQSAGRFDTESAWIRGAIAAAVAVATKREGGVLPPAPPRLPNKLARG